MPLRELLHVHIGDAHLEWMEEGRLVMLLERFVDNAYK